MTARYALHGALLLGALGAVVGLLLGLAAHPPTAWFAVLELGAPSAVVGGLLGALVGLLRLALRT